MPVSDPSSRRHPTAVAILAAARALLTDVEVASLTMDAVARRAYVARSSIYVHAPSKRALIRQLLQDALADAAAATRLYTAGQASPQLRLRAAVAQMARVAAREAPVIARLGEIRTYDPELWVTLHRTQHALLDQTARRAAFDQRAGLLTAVMPPAAAARVLFELLSAVYPQRGLALGPEWTVHPEVLAGAMWRAVYVHPVDAATSQGRPE